MLISQVPEGEVFIGAHVAGYLNHDGQKATVFQELSEGIEDNEIGENHHLFR